MTGYAKAQNSAAFRSTPIPLAKDSVHYAPGIINASVASDSISLLQNYRLSKFDQRDATSDCSICEEIPFIWSPIIGLCGAIFSAFYLFIKWESDTGHQQLNGYMMPQPLPGSSSFFSMLPFRWGISRPEIMPRDFYY
jgi:hypothetical protein